MRMLPSAWARAGVRVGIAAMAVAVAAGSGAALGWKPGVAASVIVGAGVAAAGRPDVKWIAAIAPAAASDAPAAMPATIRAAPRRGDRTVAETIGSVAVTGPGPGFRAESVAVAGPEDRAESVAEP